VIASGGGGFPLGIEGSFCKWNRRRGIDRPSHSSSNRENEVCNNAGMTRSIVLAAFSIVGAVPSSAQSPVKATPLLAKDLPGIAGKEALLITVELAPGAGSPPHKHEASTFVYALEGSVVMAVKGGETFYETPDDVHTVSRNASTTKSAKFVVFMVKTKGAPVSMPVHTAH